MSYEGWYQVSRKHRMIARLPAGKTGIQALAHAARDVVHDAADWARRLGEVQAGDQYLRCYADTRTLDSAEWDAFLKSGGTTYHEAALKRSDPR